MLLWISFALGQTPVVPPTDPGAAAWAILEQQSLPAWAARQRTAELQIAARQAFLDGEGSFSTAFPDLTEARLGNRAAVRGRLAALQDAATAREGERLRALPAVPEPQRLIAKTARNNALDAENAADELTRRLLTRVDAILQERTTLTDEAVDTLTARQRAILAAPTPEDEEARRAHDREVALADAALARTAKVRRELLLYAIDAGPAPDPQPDIDLMDDPEQSELALVRLWWMRALLPPALVAKLEAPDPSDTSPPAVPSPEGARPEAAPVSTPPAPEAASTEIPEAIVGLDADGLTAAIAAVDERITALQRQLNVLPAGHPLLIKARSEQNAAKAYREVVQDRLMRVQNGMVDRASAAAAAATKARREAEEAAQADDAVERARATLLSRAADASERLEALTAEVEETAATGLAARQTRQAQVAAFEAETEAIIDAPPLPGSGPDADKVYARLRRMIRELSTSDVALGTGIEQAREAMNNIRERVSADQVLLEEASAQASERDTLDRWSESLTIERQTAQELVTLATEHRAAMLVTLRHLAQIRRTLRDYASWTEQQVDSDEQLEEVQRELQLLRPTIITQHKNRLGEVLSYPRRLVQNGGLFTDLLWSLFWTALLLGGWSWARGRSADLAGRLTWQVRRLQPALRPIDLARLKVPLTQAVLASIDLTLGYLMVGRISNMSVEIGFFVECWLLLAIYRFFLAGFDLAVVRAPDFRPCLVTLAPASYDIVRFTAQLFIVWMIARGFTHYLSWGLLGMDATTSLAMALFSLIGLALAIWQLNVWQPMLHERIRSRNQESWLVSVLSRDVPAILKPLAALVMLAFFVVSLTVDITYWLLARDRTGLARVFNVVSRFQMGETEGEVTLDPAVWETLVGQGEATVHVVRPGIDEACGEALSAWFKEGRRGMLALVGDRGEGKRTEIARFLEQISDPDLLIARKRLSTLITHQADALKLLAELGEVEPTTAVEELILRLRERPRTVFVIEQLHRTFSRTVGGFEAIQTMLYVLNATSDHHFWLVSLHRHAWNYLASVPSIVDVGVFRKVVSLEPLDGTALRDLAERRCARTGLTIDYTSLMRTNLLGADPKVELERAISGFYRLLAEASDGNPRVAIHLFADCLEPVPDGNIVRVHRRRALATEVASEISVDALFTLVALRQQDAMDLQEIVKVTNLPESSVRNIVRDLQARGLLEATEQSLYIPVALLPYVTRTLRRRHLLALGS